MKEEFREGSGRKRRRGEGKGREGLARSHHEDTQTASILTMAHAHHWPPQGREGKRGEEIFLLTKEI